MNILKTIENTGGFYKKTASTLGGEYSGPCPFCGGKDRFSIHPNKDHFVCRQCKKAGDSIKFLREYYNLSYFEACSKLGVQPNIKSKSLNTAFEDPAQNNIVWTPREIDLPNPAWQNKAAGFLFECYKYLLSPHGKAVRTWLNNRGISDQTIKQARLGYNTKSVSFDRESWGLLPEKKENGLNKTIWIPEGLIIPQFVGKLPIRLRIRQEKPLSSDRFIMVPGSSMGFFDYTVHVGAEQDLSKPVLITEAELDGWLLHQELGDKFQIYAIGNVSARPDKYVHNCIKHLPILLNLDDDPAGHNEQQWWLSQYNYCLTQYSDFGKDPGESYEVGVDIRKWGLEGLKKLSSFNAPQVIVSKTKQTDKADIIEKKKAQDNIPEKKKILKTIKPKSSETVCIHGLDCQSQDENICLINKQDVYLINKCPKNQWTKFKDNEFVYSIVLGPGVRR